MSSLKDVPNHLENIYVQLNTWYIIIDTSESQKFC